MRISAYTIAPIAPPQTASPPNKVQNAFRVLSQRVKRK
jgi:hypothetical protein